MKRLLLLTVVGVLLTITVKAGSQQCDNHCYPGASCWPSLDEELELYKNIKGDVYSPYDTEYRDAVVMINTRVTKLPFFIVMASSVSDVIYAVKFANKYNMKITIRSSGHDYIGRATGDGSLQINLGKMQDLKFNLNSTRHPAGEVTAQSGNPWLRVYREASKLGRVIVGGSAHTVSMGGYTLGGGHSPIGRKFGMAVDNLLEVEMVAANGSLVYANASGTNITDLDTGMSYYTSNTDLFWAVRGGGGSTFGIVTAFTYKIHHDSKMARMSCYFNTSDNATLSFLEEFDKLASTSLAPEWGGYEIVSPAAIYLFLNHFGESGSSSFNTISPFLPVAEKHCSFQNVSNFLEYEETAKDALYYRSYIYNTLLQPSSFTPEYYSFMVAMFSNPTTGALQASLGCTGVLIGGNMKINDPDSTAVNPNFRTGIYSMTCGMGWSNPFADSAVIALAEEFTRGLVRHGKGTYFNEPSAYLPDWKTAYWGGHYDRLLAVKLQWDPENVFTCLHCVGSDLVPTGNTTGTHPAVPDIHIPAIVG